jgi:ankyrin repeat protein
MWASQNGHYEVVTILINAGANIHDRNKVCSYADNNCIFIIYILLLLSNCMQTGLLYL